MFKVFGKSPIRAYLRLNQWLWNRLPPLPRDLRAVRAYGNLLHRLVRTTATRGQNFGTLFLRNRPQLELICRLANQKETAAPLNISVIACSKGAEVYSILWAVRSARPDLKVILHAVDISKEVLEFAQRGVYSLRNSEFSEAKTFERLTEQEMREMFDAGEDSVRVKQWIRDGITWHHGDARDPRLHAILGPQDIVVANNFLCHMDEHDAEECLRNIAGLVRAGGYVFVSGIDLQVRTRVARDLGWKPLVDLMEDIHDGDRSLRHDWPWKYWGLEPLDKTRPDWRVRYASAFLAGAVPARQPKARTPDAVEKL